MTDRVIIERLEFPGFCGVSEEERTAPQPMAVDLELAVDMAAAASTDDLSRTVDYTRVTERVLALVQSERFHLLEVLAERLTRMILTEFPVHAVTLWVRKLKPPVRGVRDSIGVRMTRCASESPETDRPSAWLVQHQHILPLPGRALDLACGRGRNAIYLAREGFQVDAWDRDTEALGELQARAESQKVTTITTRVVDLEREPEIPAAAYDAVLVCYYLQRDLAPQIMRALKPGGLLVYETFLIENHERFHHPRRCEFCLTANELLSLFAGLRVLAYREGALDPQTGPFTAALVAQRPA